MARSSKSNGNSKKPATRSRKAAPARQKRSGSSEQAKRFQALGDAVNKFQAVIEFDLEGNILWANENFLEAFGYEIDDVVGQHHRMFVDSEYSASQEYRQFWKDLARGTTMSGDFPRVGSEGQQIWIHGSYNPVPDAKGNPCKIVKYAADITASKLQAADVSGQLDAIGKAQAVIEFDLEGNILTANENFLATLGYTLDEVKGQHHRMFVDSAYAASAEYKQFWAELGSGEFMSGEFQRFGKGGKEIWIQATYNPILDPNGEPYKVVKYATDITQEKIEKSDYSGQLDAIGKAQAVIEFDLEGNILTANENFLTTLGYSLQEIQGKHHRMFVDSAYAASAEYKQFWADLGRGEFMSGEFQRFGKDGKEIWIQATYNPILDPSGEPYKVVKYATDITEAKIRIADLSGQLDAIGKAQAVIEFDLEGNILTANENFLGALGYSLEEIQGKHHRMFVDAAYAASQEYRQFWAELGRGEFAAGEFQRFAKDGSEIWIQASYNPILDPSGNPYKVVKFATDITASKLQSADYAGQLDAIDKAQAVIEFDLDGNIQTANENFLNTVGYTLQEVKGRHHRLFVDDAYAASQEYKQFWADLRDGQFKAGEFCRYGKGHKEVWIQASYNPILDPSGNPYKVVKYASDITAAKMLAKEVEESREQAQKQTEIASAQVEQIMEALSRAADNDYSEELTVRGEDAIGKLADGIRDFIDNKQQLEVQVEAQHKAEREKAETEQKQALETERKVDVVLQLVNALSDGHFDIEVPDLGDDPVGKVASALDKAVGSIRSALQNVEAVSGTVASAAQEMTGSSAEISKGAQRQAARLEETASSLEEITATVKQNSENAQQARQLANGSKDIAESGGQVVGKAVEAMGEINDSSKKIADIITTIDEIAFQTNLLALNAAVEAARAGEQGRGFAVVAAEVRSLAQRSASSAKEIKSLIQDSVSKVEKGTDLVNNSGKTLGDIVESVKRVTDIVAEIAAASQEQLSGIELVNNAVSEMDRVTQASANQTEEMSGTSSSLLGHAQQLNNLVKQFSLGTSHAAAMATTSNQPAAPAQWDAGPAQIPASAPVQDASGFDEVDGMDAEQFIEF